jgi:type VI secretion system secreted protein Hcp
MATDIFAKIGTIKGESTDSKHKDEVEVLSWSWGMSETAGTGPVPAGKTNFSDFHFTHHIDKASPALMAACATGQHIKDATITVRKAGKGQQEFLIFKMSEIIVTSVQPSVSTAENGFEGVTLKPAKVDFEYRPQKPDGTLDVGVHFKYDIKLNKEG